MARGDAAAGAPNTGTADAQAEVLAGGVANAGAVIRIGDTVRRPRRRTSDAARAVLVHLESVGFAHAPRYLGFDEHDRDVFTFVSGDVPLPPYPKWALTDQALRDVARLVREFHDAMTDFRADASSGGHRVVWSTDLNDPLGGDVICHNDVCPENVVFRDGRAVALLDFDFVAPGRRYWDVARTIRMWGPMGAPGTRKEFPRDLDCCARLATFTRAYGVPPSDAEEFVSVLFEAFRQGVRWVRAKVEAGEPAFVAMSETYGLADRHRADVVWFGENGERMVRAIQRRG